MDEVAENSDALMERYLEGEEISHEEIVTALEDGTDQGHIFPVTCGVATAHLGADRLLDALVDDLPSPVQHGGLKLPDMTLEPTADGETYAYVFKTRADPFAGRINLFRVYQGTVSADSHLLNTRAHAKERMGQLLVPQGKEVTHIDAFGPGDIGAVAKLKETRAGDWLADRDQPISMPSIALPAPVMAFAIEAKAKGDEDKVFSSLRRLQEEDPTIDLHRDPQTGEQIVAGLSQIHVEVVVDRLKSRFGAEVTLKPPRVPYQETIRGSAKAHGRHKKQSGGRGQFGDCHIEVEPLAEGDFEFVNAIKGGVIPTSFIPAVEKGVIEAMSQGVVAGFPVKGVRVRLFDGSYHTVDSSEMAFKIAGSIAMRQALEQAGPVLLEPIMLVSASVPEANVGDVMGDLSSRRGRPLGTEAAAGMTEVKAEVPMSRAAHLRARPALDHRRPGRVHARVPALRGDARPPGAKDRAEGARRRRKRSRPEPLPLLRSPRGGEHQGHPHESGRHLLRCLRAHAAARRARRVLPRRRRAPPGLRALHGARAARGLDPRGRRRGADAARLAHRARARVLREAARPPRARPRGGRRSPRPPRPPRRPPRAASQPQHEPPPDLPRRPRHVRAVPTNAELKVERALEVFNASEHTRTVGGIARSLGAPGVSARPLPDRPSVVGIAVMWELSWYRFEIDLSDEAGGVRQVAQGAELSELDPDELLGNAAADERGSLHLAVAE